MATATKTTMKHKNLPKAQDATALPWAGHELVHPCRAQS